MLDDGAGSQKPYEVIFAVRLLWYSIGLEIVNTILNWPLLLTLLPSNLPFDRDLFCLFTKVFVMALITWLICKISLGYNWARILFFLGFILAIPIMLPTMLSMLAYSKIFIFISAAIIIFQFTALSLLFSDAGNSWYKEQRGIPKESF